MASNGLELNGWRAEEEVKREKSSRSGRESEADHQKVWAWGIEGRYART